MGGIGSGRGPRLFRRPTTAESRPIDLRLLRQEGRYTSDPWTLTWTLAGHAVAAVEIVLIGNLAKVSLYGYKAGQPIRIDESRIELHRTPCRYGGTRLWFVCPESRCHRRVAILYWRDYVACRRCHGLAYHSTRMTALDRTEATIEMIRARLGWVGGFLNGFGSKPRWMRWPTFHRLVAEHERLVRAVLQSYRADQCD